jgi:hypothetical protein
VISEELHSRVDLSPDEIETSLAAIRDLGLITSDAGSRYAVASGFFSRWLTENPGRQPDEGAAAPPANQRIG